MIVPVFWFTGLSGAGKSTIADGVASELRAEGRRVLILDGDVVRAQLHRNLGFSEDDIVLNNSLIAELCAEKRNEADVIMVPIISPFRKSRAAARRALAPGFFEIYLKANVDTVVSRDVKGLYAKASRGEIAGMIGVSADAVPYEEPESPDLIIDVEQIGPAEAIERFRDFLRHCLTESIA